MSLLYAIDMDGKQCLRTMTQAPNFVAAAHFACEWAAKEWSVGWHSARLAVWHTVEGVRCGPVWCVDGNVVHADTCARLIRLGGDCYLVIDGRVQLLSRAKARAWLRKRDSRKVLN